MEKGPTSVSATAFEEFAGTEVEHLGEDLFGELLEALTRTLAQPSNAGQLRTLLESTKTRRHHPRLLFAEEVICICVEICGAFDVTNRDRTNTWARNRAKRIRLAGAAAIKGLTQAGVSSRAMTAIENEIANDATEWEAFAGSKSPESPQSKAPPAKKFYTEAQQKVRGVLIAAGIKPKHRAREYAARIVCRMMGLKRPEEVQSKLIEIERAQYVNWYVQTLLSVEPELRRESEKLSARLQTRAKEKLPSRLILTRRRCPHPTDAELEALRKRIDTEADRTMHHLLDGRDLSLHAANHLRTCLNADARSLQRELTALRRTPKP